MNQILQDHWSGSETASLSEEQPDLANSFLTMFDCADGKRCHCLESKYLKRFLSSNDMIIPHESMEIFGIVYSPSIICDSKERQKIFKLIRFHIFQLLNCSFLQQNISHKGSSIRKLRHQISSFTSSLVSTVKCYKDDFGEECRKEICKEFTSLMKSIGAIHDSPQWLDCEVTSTMNYHVFHLRLELKVHMLLLLAIPLCNSTEVPSDSTEVPSGCSEFEDAARCLMMDLIVLAGLMYTKMSRKNDSASPWTHSPWTREMFMCDCCKQAWLVVLHILKKFETMSLESFWTMLSRCLSNDDSSRIGSWTNRTSCNFSEEMKMWIVTSIAPLYWIDVCGNDGFNDALVVPGNWITVQDTLQKQLTQDISDDSLKLFVWSCLKLTNHWMPNVEIFNMLLDHFNKKLNELPKRKSSNGLIDFVQSRSSEEVVTQLEAIQSLSVIQPRDLMMPSIDDTPYDLFLRYVCRTIRKLKETNSQTVLSHVKKRMYNKFHKRRLLEFNHVGVRRFTSLFIAVALTIEDKDIVSKTITLLNIKSSSCNQQQQQQQQQQQSLELKKQLVSSYFMLLHLCERQDISTENIISVIVQHFNDAVKHLMGNRHSKTIVQSNISLIQFILMYIEQYYDNFKCTKEGLKLLCPAYKRLLNCRATELQCLDLIAHIHRVVTLFFNNKKASAQYKGIVLDVLHTLFYESVDQLYVAIPSRNIMEVFSSLTLLSIQSNGSLTEQYLQKYAFDTSKNASYRSHYIVKLLHCQSALNYIEVGNHIVSMIRVWLSCCICSPDDALLLSRGLLQLPTLSQYVANTCVTNDDVNCIVFQFISGVGNAYNNLKTVTEMWTLRKFVDMCFNGFVGDMEQLLTDNSQKSSTAIITAFEIGGRLAKHCSEAIYSKSSPKCLLPRLLDLFVLPLITTKKSHQPDHAKMRIKYLHYFLQGVSWLDLTNDDFLKRKTRDIMDRYFIDCCMASYKNHNEKNPFLISLLPSCAENPRKVFSDYRSFLMIYIKEKYLQSFQKPVLLSCIMYFFGEVVATTKSRKELLQTMKLLFDKILISVLLCETTTRTNSEEAASIKRIAVKILKTLKDLNDKESHKYFCDTIMHFVRGNIHYYQATVLKTLRVMFVTCPTIVRHILDDVNKTVYDFESERGVGIDGNLREGLNDLHSLIDAANNKERR